MRAAPPYFLPVCDFIAAKCQVPWESNLDPNQSFDFGLKLIKATGFAFCDVFSSQTFNAKINPTKTVGKSHLKIGMKINTRINIRIHMSQKMKPI